MNGILLAGLMASMAVADPWARHAIDDSSRGADGVRLADANGDGFLDIVTGWEEGGVVRVCLSPGPDHAKNRWPAVTVGTVGNVEDAVFVDLDGDGALDVVSSCEGSVRAMYVHWAPSDSARILESSAWETELLPASSTDVMWMFCLPMDVDGKHGIDLVAGGKGAGAEVGWFEAPEDPRDLAAWRWHPLQEAGWIMSLIAADMDGDGDDDVLVTDRKGAGRGVLWLEHVNTAGDWPIHRIGCEGQEVMFAALGDLDGDGLDDVLTLVKPNIIVWLRRTGDGWERHDIPMPESAGRAKAVNVADIDLDGKMDLVFTCESADAPKSGCMWMSCDGTPSEGKWTAHDVSGPEGIKYDLIEPIDMDADGDLDLLTCEERENLGVFWYENPTATVN